MSSLPSQMYLSQHAPSPTEVLGELLEAARARFAAIETALEEAKESPLDLQNHFEDILEDLEAQRAQHAEIGEMLLRALLAGHGHEVAALCIEWTALETLRMNVPSFSSPPENETTQRVEESTEAPRTNAGDEDLPSTKATDTSSFRTVEVSKTPKRSSPESILSLLSEPVVERTRIAEVITEDTSPPVDLSTVDTSALFANGQGFDAQPANTRHAMLKDLQKVQELIRDAGTPSKGFLRVTEADEPMHALKRFIEKRNLERIASLPNAWHHAVTDYITAYARHMQEAICETFSDVQEYENEFHKIFRTLTNFSEKSRPGYIIGLKKDSHPNDGKTWHLALQERRQTLDELSADIGDERGDAREMDEARCAARTDVLRRLHETVSGDDASNEKVVTLVREALALQVDVQHPRLLSALKAHRKTLEVHDDLKAVVRALTLAEREETLSTEAEDGNSSELDHPWPFKEHTEGKRLAIIGGNRRQSAEEKIREAFALEEVVWVSTSSGKHARQRKFRSSFKNGSYDFVVAIQTLVGHAWTDMIFNDRPENTVAALSTGYGVQAIGRALARYGDWAHTEDSD